MSALFIGLVLVQIGYFECENHCERRRQQCEQRCSETHTVGSMGHLKCNDRCRERKHECRKECD